MSDDFDEPIEQYDTIELRFQKLKSRLKIDDLPAAILALATAIENSAPQILDSDGELNIKVRGDIATNES